MIITCFNLINLFPFKFYNFIVKYFYYILRYDILYSGTANNKLYRKWMEESIHKFDTLPFAIDIETGKEMIGLRIKYYINESH